MESQRKLDRTTPENQKLISDVRAQGFTDRDIDDIIEIADSPEEALDDLKYHGTPYEPPKGAKVTNPPRAPLAPHEQEVFERIVTGDLMPEPPEPPKA